VCVCVCVCVFKSGSHCVAYAGFELNLPSAGIIGMTHVTHFSVHFFCVTNRPKTWCFRTALAYFTEIFWFVWAFFLLNTGLSYKSGQLEAQCVKQISKELSDNPFPCIISFPSV
jgi:hypothetical protein